MRDVFSVAPRSGCDGACGAGQSAVSTDCDDGNAAIKPGAAEIVGNGVDEDCNGHDSISCYVDADIDGFGNMYIWQLLLSF